MDLVSEVGHALCSLLKPTTTEIHSCKMREQSWRSLASYLPQAAIFAKEELAGVDDRMALDEFQKQELSNLLVLGVGFRAVTTVCTLSSMPGTKCPCVSVEGFVSYGNFQQWLESKTGF